MLKFFPLTAETNPSIASFPPAFMRMNGRSEYMYA